MLTQDTMQLRKIEIEDYIFANDFLRFLTGHLKKRKKSCFFEIWKKRKIRILEHWVRPIH